MRDDGAKGVVLFSTLGSSATVDDVTLAPNGEFVSIEVASNVMGATSDGYPVNARATNISTVIERTVDGTVVATLPGFDVSW